MSFENKGSMATTVTVSMEPDRSGNYICTGTADDAVLQQANDDLTAAYGGGKIIIKGGHGTPYDITTGIVPDDNIEWEGVGYDTHLRLADNRPNGEAADWVDWCIFVQNTESLENVSWRNMRLDGNFANNMDYGAAVHGKALIYVGQGGSNILMEGMFFTDHRQFGVTLDSYINNLYNVIIKNNVFLNHQWNALQIGHDGSSGTVYSYLIDIGPGNYFGGTIGDYGVAIRSDQAGGYPYLVDIHDNHVDELTGVNGSGNSHIGLGFEARAVWCKMDGNVIKDARWGIRVHGTDCGYHTLMNNIIMVADVANNTGMRIERPGCSVEGNYFWMPAAAVNNAVGVWSENDADDLYGADNEFVNLNRGWYLKNARPDIGENKYLNIQDQPVYLHVAASDWHFPTIPVKFYEGVTLVWADATPRGWEISEDGEYALAEITLPLRLTQVIDIKCFATSLVAEADEMHLEWQIEAGQSNEAYNAEVIAVANNDSITTNFGADDIIYWMITAANDGDIADLRGGDSLQIKVKHEAGVEPDCETDAVFRDVLIQWQ